MPSDIEMENLNGAKQRTSLTRDKDIDRDGDANDFVTGLDGATVVWTWTSAALLSALSICLVLFPRLLLFVTEPLDGRGLLTPLEAFLALNLGILLGTTSITLVLTIPNSSPSSFSHADDKRGHPLLRPVTAASVIMAFVSYNTDSVGSLATFMFVCSAATGVFGLWSILFAGSSSVSRKTGADKHTSAFLFGNKNSASVQKKQWKKQQKVQE
ncbi:hypothetical protein BJ138DRAFT_1080960 [Hygrophoropsis aurantiaca]|uniref:Uncharacterized protein n=1 Tax=Hygrophoropsis aurantiaca TaxID=72124 RepID=A0ACB8AL31_9AGAM|nr:hypothetical protein BJ138DRAFT_1080960 [Hygrophoropsis aurantiaca]